MFRVFDLQQQFETVDGLLDVLRAVLLAVPRHILNDARLAIGEPVLLAVFGWLDGKVLVVLTANLLLECVVRHGCKNGFMTSAMAMLPESRASL